jgi:hypothetical protein
MRAALNKPVVAHRVRVEHRDNDVLLSCSLRGRNGELPPELWFRFPAATGPFVDAVGDPFLPPLLLYCMKARVPLIIEADVSTMLLAGVRPIQDLYCGWAAGTDDRLTRIDVKSSAAVRPRQGCSSAAFFSCGVDSFYTLLRNVRRYPRDDSRFIQHLILVHGFDIPLTDQRLYDQVERHGRSAAQHFGKTLIAIDTNIRAATTTLDWGHYGHGAALASVGLALGRMFHTVFVPSTLALGDLRPWGSHPALDPLWSNDQVEFVHDAAEVRRIDKVRLLAAYPDALRCLRVCWINPDGAYNCGRCEKCLRTMADLAVSGALSQAAMFPDTIELRAIESLVIPASARPHWLATVEAAKHSPSHSPLVAAIQKALENREGLNSGWWQRVRGVGRRAQRGNQLV